MSSLEEMQSQQSIGQWYSGKNILITGCTGFMGKVLVEKLLRSCPGIKCLYLIIRPKKGIEPAEREQQYFSCVIFDKIRQMYPNYASKIKVIKGDVMLEDLGIEESDKNELLSETDIVFHCAANVRFDQPLKLAVEMNTGGTQRLLQMALKMPNLKAFVHVSTSYCHCNEEILEERGYPPPHDPLGILQMIRSLDDDFLEQITPRLLNGLPNTYAYSKALSEGLICNYGSKLPIVVCRPSIVTAIKKEPIPGWVEGLNGPTGLLVGAARGVIRSMHCNPKYPADVIPADTAINAIIVAGWDRAQTYSDQAEFYNVVLSRNNLPSWGENLETGKRLFYENPLSFSLWYPDGSIKSNYYLHMLAVFFFHYVPAYFLDALLFLIGQKPFLVRVQKKVSAGLKILQYYTTKQWIFKNDRLEKLRCKLNSNDQDEFDLTVDQINWEKYLYDYIIGLRVYILNERMDTIPKARKLLRRLYILDRVVKIALSALIFWFLWSYMDSIVESFCKLPSKLFYKQGRYILDISG